MLKSPVLLDILLHDLPSSFVLSEAAARKSYIYGTLNTVISLFLGIFPHTRVRAVLSFSVYVTLCRVTYRALMTMYCILL